MGYRFYLMGVCLGFPNGLARTDLIGFLGLNCQSSNLLPELEPYRHGVNGSEGLI